MLHNWQPPDLNTLVAFLVAKILWELVLDPTGSRPFYDQTWSLRRLEVSILATTTHNVIESTPSVLKRLSVFLTLARLRSADH